MTDPVAVAVGVVAVYYTGAAVSFGRREWRAQGWLDRDDRYRVAVLAAAAWPWFVWMRVRDERGSWCVLESFAGTGALDADERITARYWTARGADHAAARSRRLASGVGNVAYRVVRYDRTVDADQYAVHGPSLLGGRR